MSYTDQRPDDAMMGAFEALASEQFVSADPQIFREAMSRFGAAVHVITTDGPGGKTGFTATAVCSVSDAPPTILVCLNRKSQATPLIHENMVFCVNTLSANCQPVADAFAGRTGLKLADRFTVGEWTTLATGAPALMSAVVSCDCRVAEIKVVASHNVIFGVVESVRLGEGGEALVYHDRAYKKV